MRQLVGFVAFLITGGQSATDRLQSGQDTLGFAYSNLAFEGGVGALFNAVRAVFDPAEVTHPDWDDRLWLGDTDARDWLGARPPRPMTLTIGARARHTGRSSDASSSSTRPGSICSRSSRPMSRSSRRRLARARRRPPVVRDLVLALNRFFEPDCAGEAADHVQLWQSHRYDVRAPSTFVSFHALSTSICASSRSLRRVGRGVAATGAAGAPQLRAGRRGRQWDVAVVEIDRELFLTLLEASAVWAGPVGRGPRPGASPALSIDHRAPSRRQESRSKTSGFATWQRS